MKKLFLILSLLTCLYIKVKAQNSENIFSITIDSVTTDPHPNPQVLLCYTTIKNLSKETVEFRGIPMFKKYQEERMWNLKIKEEGIICIWESKDKYDLNIFLGNFTIKKGKTLKYRIPLVLEEMVVFDSEGGVGNYTIQIEVSNVETKKVKKQTVLSNIAEFQIETPIAQYVK